MARRQYSFENASRWGNAFRVRKVRAPSFFCCVILLFDCVLFILQAIEKLQRAPNDTGSVEAQGNNSEFTFASVCFCFLCGFCCFVMPRYRCALCVFRVVILLLLYAEVYCACVFLFFLLCFVVVVAVSGITERIRYLTEHIRTHKHDHASRYGLSNLVTRRRKLLQYLKREDYERYKALRLTLQLRPV